MREKINNIYLGGITGFIFSTLLVTVGILKTIIIVLFTCITAWGSYLIGKQVDCKFVQKFGLNLQSTYNGELTINFDSQTVKVNQNEIHLTPTEYKVLIILAENTSRVLTHRYLLKEVWGTESVEDTSSLRVTIATLRKKIEVNTQNQYIKTHIGVGYQMVQLDS